MDKPEWLGTSVVLLVLLVGILVSKALDLLDLTTVIIGVGISTIIVLGTVAIVWGFGQQSHNLELDRIIKELKEITPSAQHDWLYNATELNEIEGNIISKNIWVISPDLSNDTGTPDIDVIHMVKENLRKKVFYTFIVPDIETIKAVLPHLRKTFASRPKQLRIIYLPQEAFRMLTTAHIVIFNPNMENGRNPEVFLELPLQNRGYAKGYWIKAADDAALGFVGRFRKIVENETPNV